MRSNEVTATLRTQPAENMAEEPGPSAKPLLDPARVDTITPCVALLNDPGRHAVHADAPERLLYAPPAHAVHEEDVTAAAIEL